MVDGYVIDTTNASDWQKKIAHVPQAIFLSDATVYENIEKTATRITARRSRA